MENKGTEIKKNITELFNKVSTSFDSSGPRYFSYFGQRLVEFAGIKEGDKVLDVASGKGASLFQASDRVGEKGRVLGIDIAEGMVKETSLELERQGIKNAEIMVMDAENLDLNSEAFDHILCGFGVFFFPDYKIAFNEFKRVLKDGGRFSFTTFLRKRDEKFMWMGDLFDKYLPDYKDELSEYQKEDSPEFDTKEGLTKILQECGFKNIEIISEEKKFIYKDEQEWWDKLWTQGSREALERIPKDRLEDFRLEVFQKLSEIKEEEGIITSKAILFSRCER